MRFLLYNMRYATGPRAHGFLRSSNRNLERITAFLEEERPDLVGLIEVDNKLSRRPLSDTDVDTIRLFAVQVAASIIKINLMDGVETLTGELE